MPSTRVWVKQGLHSHRSAQVLLVPLGNIPPEVYYKYCEILRRFSTIPMQNLTAPGDWNRQNGALKHFNWSEGCFNFHFIDKDTTDGGTSEWEDYQAHRRVLGAIGVVHFPSAEKAGGADFKELERQFQAVVANYKHVHATRIFAFGHSFEQGDYPDILDPQRDIVFPPEQEFEGGGSTTELHMAVSLYDVAVSLIKTLAADVKAWNALTSPSAAGRAVAALRGKTAASPPLTSRYDREEVVTESKVAKRRVGRMHKWIGDACLLLGSPKDALEHYSQSMSDTKASSDPLWYAGCLEGYAACLSAMSDADHPTVHGDQALALLRDMAKDKQLEKAGLEGSSTWTVLAEAVVSEKCEEALAVFSRFPPLGALEVELCFKAARFHACAQPNPRWDRALAALLRALSVPDMPMQVQLERSIEAAILCESMGLKRKAALFAYLSAMLCSDFETWNTAHLLARMAGEGYGALAPLPSTPTSLRNSTSGSNGPLGDATRSVTTLNDVGGDGGGGGAREPAVWLVLRKQLLQWLLAVSARCGDARASCEYFAGLAELMAALEEEREKADRYLVTLPPPPSEGASAGGIASPPVPLVMEALGNVAVSGKGAPAPPLGSTRDNRMSWSDRMMRRGTTEGSQMSFPLTPSTASAHFGSSSGVGGSSTRETFLSSGHTRTPTAPASPIQRLENMASEYMQAAPPASTIKKSRKVSLPKSIGRKITSSRSTGSRKEGSSTATTATPLLEGGGVAGGGGGSGTVPGGGGTSGSAVAHQASLSLEEQWETLSEMAQCTSRLTPEDATKVQMLGVPRLESARLIHFEGPLALLPGDGATTLESNYPSAQAAATQAAATRSALFYNPFEDSPELGDHTFGGDGDAGGGVCWDEGEEESDGTGGAGVGGDGGGGDGGGGQGSDRSARNNGTSSNERGGSGGSGDRKAGQREGTGAGVGGIGGGGSGRGGGGGPGPGAELPARWAAGEAGQVIARFSNPLRVPLELESVTVAVEGAKVQAFPTSVLLPPKANFYEVVLYFKPLDEGQVILRGVTIEVLSLVTLCKVDKWGRGVFVGPRLPPRRTYQSLRATFRRPREVLTTDTVDIAAAAAAAAAVAEAAAAAAEAEAEAEAEEGSATGGEGDARTGTEEPAIGDEDVGGEGVDVIGGGSRAKKEAVGGGVPASGDTVGGVKGGTIGGGSGTVEDDGKKAQEQQQYQQYQQVEDNADNEEQAEEMNEKEKDEEGDEEHFVADPHMRRGETVCRKLRVEGAAPLVRLSRTSPATSEALAGEETEELLEMVNESGLPITVMDIWTRPSSGLGAVIGNSTATASAAKRSPASTALLFSLGGSSPPDGSSSSSSSRGNDDTDNYTSSSQTSGNNGGVFAAGAAFPCSSLGVALASPVQFTDSVAEGGGIAAGGGAKVALRLRAGQASGRGAITEVMVKYSEKKGAAFHRQLRLPFRLAIRGGLRLCSLRVAQFLEGGLRFDADADATECLLLLELANDSDIPMFVWRCGRSHRLPYDTQIETANRNTKAESDRDGGDGGDLSGKGDPVVDIPGGSRRCLSLRVPRLSVAPERKNESDDQLRSPLALRPLFEWEKCLSEHLCEQLALRWSTSSDDAERATRVSSASSSSSSGVASGGVESAGGPDKDRSACSNDGIGGGILSGSRRGSVTFALDQIDDDGCCVSAAPGVVRKPNSGGGGGGGGGVGSGYGGNLALPQPRRQQRHQRHQPRHPQAVPECLLGALLPPVRLTCLPVAVMPTKGGGKPPGVGLYDDEGFPQVRITEAGGIQVEGGEAEGADGVEGAWAAKTTVDSFLPVSLVVHNPSPWAVEVEVEVTSKAEGSDESRAWGDDDSVDPSHAMWSGMPRRHLGKLAPGSSVHNGLVACFLTPGDISIGFTCRVKVESESAPYGSSTATAVRPSGSGGGKQQGSDRSEWHPVLCHLPLTVSVVPKEAEGVQRRKPQVCRVGPRVGTSTAYQQSGNCDIQEASVAVAVDADANAGASDPDGLPAGFDRLSGTDGTG